MRVHVFAHVSVYIHRRMFSQTEHGEDCLLSFCCLGFFIVFIKAKIRSGSCSCCRMSDNIVIQHSNTLLFDLASCSE